MEPGARTSRRYAGKDASERTEERRVRLLDAGLQVYGTTGFAASAIETICAEARVSTRTFYELFGRKEQLLLDVDARIVERTAARIRAALAAAPPGVADRVSAGLHAYAAGFAQDPRTARVHFFEVLAVVADSDAHRRVTGDQLMELFLTEGASWMEQGLIPRRDLSITSGALLGATRYAMTDWMISDGAYPVEKVIAELVRLYVLALGASNAAG
ncbi:MAG TPA: helix-turn-helix domain-containing protein [Solirubrobacteraceae bacterium]|jgi:AcrR family transcriptional regulator